MNSLAERIRADVTSRREQIVTDLIACIRLNTVNPPGNEETVAKYIAQRMSSIGVETEFQQVFPGRPNLICSLKHGEGPCLLLNSHMDTVPTGDRSLWAHDPFGGEVVDGIVYGRGACDAKGSVVAMMAAIETAVRLEIPFRGEVLFTPVMWEEGGGKGTAHFVRTGMAGRKPVAAVVGEPTEGLVALGHRGSNRRLAVFHGRAAHSSVPEKGVNSIYFAARLALEIEKLHTKLRQGEGHPLLGTGVASANIIAGGVKHNTIPERTELTIDRRRTWGEGSDQLDRELEEIVNRLTANDPSFNVEFKDLGIDKEPTLCDASELIVRQVQDAVEVITGRRPPLTGVEGGTDMSFIVNEGHVPCVIYGPGDMNAAHALDEYVSIEQLLEASAVYAVLISEVLR